jgi:hypothetical protein
VPVRPRPGNTIPTLTVRMARASNPGGTTAMLWVRDHLEGLWGDADFTCWYPRDGRPGLSPAQLATVCVLQFVLNLSDRQAAEAVRCRIDFKYALSLELDDPGFPTASCPTSVTASPRVIGPTAYWILRWTGCGPPGCSKTGAGSAPIPPMCWPPSGIWPAWS